MAERVGFKAANAETCTGLHGPVQTQKTRHLYRFQSPLDFIDLFRGLIQTENVAQQDKI
jgi:hypothetical protein